MQLKRTKERRVVISTTMTPEAADHLHRVARRTGKTRSAVIEEALAGQVEFPFMAKKGDA